MKRLLSLAIIFCFLAEQCLFAFSAPLQVPAPSVEAPVIHSISIPEELGEIKIEHRSDEKSPFVVYIQDAHTIIDAQNNIRQMIAYLQNKYKLNLVLLEGGEGLMDPTLFRHFPDKEVREKVMRTYLSRGEITGVSMAAITNEHNGQYYGIEDWDLYETNYMAYLQAVQNRNKIISDINTIRQRLNKERLVVYSEVLNSLHTQLEAFYSEEKHLLDLLMYFSKLDEARSAIAKYSELRVLVSSLTKDSDEKKAESLEQSIRSLAEGFEINILPKLTKRDAMKFSEYRQSFETSQMEAGAFLKWVVDRAAEFGFQPKLTAAMKELLGRHETFTMIKGTNLFDELRTFIAEIEQELITNSKQLSLSEDFKKLRLLENLANLEMSPDEWSLYSENPAAYITLMDNPALFKPALQFYALAEERDQIFTLKIKEILKRQNAHGAIVIMGGFHAQGFERHFSNLDYSYAVVTPKIKSLEGHEVYEDLMHGNLSYKHFIKQGLYDGFARHASLQFVKELDEPNFRKNIKLWRDNVIRDLAAQNRVGEASQYTKYIDLVFKAYLEKFKEGLTFKQNREMIERAIDAELRNFEADLLKPLNKQLSLELDALSKGMRALKLDNRLTPANVRRLLSRAQAQKPAALVQSLANLFPELKSSVLGPDGISEEALSEELTARLERVIQEVSVASGLPAEAVSVVVRNIILKTTPLAASATQSSQAVEGRSELREAYNNLFDNLQSSFDAGSNDAFRSLLEMADLSHLLRNPAYGLERSIDLSHNAIRAVINGRLRQAEQRISTDAIFARSAAREIETLFVRMNQPIPLDLQARLKAVSESTVDVILNEGLNTESGSLLIDKNIAIDPTALQNTKEIMDRTVPFSAPGDQIATLLTVAGVKPGALVFHNQPNRAGLAEALRQAHPNLVVIPEPSQAAGLFVGNRERLEFLISQPAYQNFLRETLGPEGADLALDDLVSGIINRDIDPGIIGVLLGYPVQAVRDYLSPEPTNYTVGSQIVGWATQVPFDAENQALAEFYAYHAGNLAAQLGYEQLARPIRVNLRSSASNLTPPVPLTALVPQDKDDVLRSRSESRIEIVDLIDMTEERIDEIIEIAEAVYGDYDPAMEKELRQTILANREWSYAALSPEGRVEAFIILNPDPEDLGPDVLAEINAKADRLSPITQNDIVEVVLVARHPNAERGGVIHELFNEGQRLALSVNKTHLWLEYNPANTNAKSAFDREGFDEVESAEGQFSVMIKNISPLDQKIKREEFLRQDELDEAATRFLREQGLDENGNSLRSESRTPEDRKRAGEVAEIDELYGLMDYYDESKRLAGLLETARQQVGKYKERKDNLERGSQWIDDRDNELERVQRRLEMAEIMVRELEKGLNAREMTLKEVQDAILGQVFAITGEVSPQLIRRELSQLSLQSGVEAVVQGNYSSTLNLNANSRVYFLPTASLSDFIEIRRDPENATKVIIKSRHQETDLVVDKTQFIRIGRQPQNDIVLRDDADSRFQMALAIDITPEGQVSIRAQDIFSMNGSLIYWKDAGAIGQRRDDVRRLHRRERVNDASIVIERESDSYEKGLVTGTFRLNPRTGGGTFEVKRQSIKPRLALITRVIDEIQRGERESRVLNLETAESALAYLEDLRPILFDKYVGKGKSPYKGVEEIIEDLAVEVSALESNLGISDMEAFIWHLNHVMKNIDPGYDLDQLLGHIGIALVTIQKLSGPEADPPVEKTATDKLIEQSIQLFFGDGYLQDEGFDRNEFIKNAGLQIEAFQRSETRKEDLADLAGGVRHILVQTLGALSGFLEFAAQEEGTENQARYLDRVQKYIDESKQRIQAFQDFNEWVRIPYTLASYRDDVEIIIPRSYAAEGESLTSVTNANAVLNDAPGILGADVLLFRPLLERLESMEALIVNGDISQAKNAADELNQFIYLWTESHLSGQSILSAREIDTFLHINRARLHTNAQMYFGREGPTMLLFEAERVLNDQGINEWQGPQVPKELYENKRVLSLAYGELPFFLAESAETVVGVDFDFNTIAYQKMLQKYRNLNPAEYPFMEVLKNAYSETNRKELIAALREFQEFVRSEPQEDSLLPESNLEFVRGSITQLPHEDGSFDFIVMPFIFGHRNGIETREAFEAAIHELLRVLAPGGQILISPFFSDGPIDRYYSGIATDLFANWIFLNSGRNFTHRLSDPFQVFPESENMTHIKGEFLLISKPDEALSEKPRAQIFKRSETRSESPRQLLNEDFEAIPLQMRTYANRMFLNAGPAFESLGLDASRIEPIPMSAIEPYIYKEKATGKLYYAYERNRMIGNLKQYVIFEKARGLLSNLVEVRLIGEESDQDQIVLTEIAESISDERLLTSSTRAEDALLFMLLFGSWDHHPRVQHNIHAREINGRMRYVLYDYANAQSPNFVRSPLSRDMIQTAVDHFENMELEGDYLFDRIVQLAEAIDPGVLNALNKNIEQFFQMRSETRSEEQIQIASLVNVTSEELIRLFLSDEALQNLRQKAAEELDEKREGLRETLVSVLSILMADEDDEEQKIVEAIDSLNEGLKQTGLNRSLPDDAESILRPIVRNLLSQIRELQSSGALNEEYLKMLPILVNALRERMQPLSSQEISQNVNLETLAAEIKLGSQAAILRAADLSASQGDQLRKLLQDSPEALARMERLLQTEAAVSQVAKDLGISITGDLNRRTNRRQLLALKENIKDIGHRFTAHGTGALGGLRNLINIILTDGISDEVYVGPLALNRTGSPDLMKYASTEALPHGPNYVIFDRDLDNWNTTAGHVYYIVPEAGDREVVLEVLKREGRHDLIETVQSRIVTYEEFVSAHRSENRITATLIEILDLATNDERQILNFLATGNRAELFAPEAEPITMERRSSLFDKFARFDASAEFIEDEFATRFKYQGIEGTFKYAEEQIRGVSSNPENFLRTLKNLRKRFDHLYAEVTSATDQEFSELSNNDLFRMSQLSPEVRDRILGLEEIDDYVKVNIVIEALSSLAIEESIFEDGRFDSVSSFLISEESDMRKYWNAMATGEEIFNMQAIAELINDFPKYADLKLKGILDYYLAAELSPAERRELQKRIRTNLVRYYLQKRANGNNFKVMFGQGMSFEDLTPQIANFALDVIQNIPQPLSHSIQDRMTLTITLLPEPEVPGQAVSLGHYIHGSRNINLNFYGTPTPEALARYDITKTTHHEFTHLASFMNPRLLESGAFAKLVGLNNFKIVILNDAGELESLSPENVTEAIRNNLYYKNYVYVKENEDGSETLVSFVPGNDLEDPLVVKLREAGVHVSADNDRRHMLANVEEIMAYTGSELLDTPYSRFVMERFAGRRVADVRWEDMFKGQNIPYVHEGQSFEVPVNESMRVKFAKSLFLLQQTVLRSQHPVALSNEGAPIYEIYFPQGNAAYLKIYVDDRFMNLDVDTLGDNFNTDELRGIMFKSLEVARVRAERSELRVDTQSVEAQAIALADRLIDQMRVMPEDYTEEYAIKALDALLDEISSFLNTNNLEITWFGDILEKRSRTSYARDLVNGSREVQAQFVSEESAAQFSKYIGMLHVSQKAIFNEYVVGADLGRADATQFEKSIDTLMKMGDIRVFLSKATVKGLPRVAQKYPGSVSSGSITQLMTGSYLGDNDVVPVVSETTSHAAFVSDLLIGIIEEGAASYEDDVFGNETSLLARSFIAAQVARLKLKSRRELSAEKIKEHVAIALFTERFVDLGLQALKYENGRLSVNRELLNRFINQHLGEAMVAASA